MRIAFIYIYYSGFYVKSQQLMSRKRISTHCSRGVKGMSNIEKREKNDKTGKNF